ncbi:Endo-1%2C4-beta-xylanase A precursor [uncultured Ruminococcus sp.]|nr:Endo-1%2C4-beta-xylanase A precursor [uncultured Ruminococcus sp.]
MEDRNVAHTVYVSTTGNDDTGDGSQGKPFATIEKAKEHVRTLDKDSGDIVVKIAGGLYELEDTIVFDENDSGNENCTIYYEAVDGEEPIISGGKLLEGDWEEATEVDWLDDGIKAYKTDLVRNDKLRAIYVNGERASMTRRSARPLRSVGNYSVTKGEADWAWISKSGIKEGNVFAADFGLPADTRNPQNIELESGSTWVKAIVCADTLEETPEGDTQVNFQMPYAAIAQQPSWNCNYNPTGNNDVVNVFEWLSEPGEFYFDQAGSTLYYIPKEGEDMADAEVIIPELVTLVDIKGSTPKQDYAAHITFRGLTFAYSDWNLAEVDGSHGNATVQGCTYMNKFSTGNWHDDMYRSYDVAPAAVHATSAHDIAILDGKIEMTGYLGFHAENDVYNIEVTGNYIGHTGGGGVTIGHPQHVYENDTEEHWVGGSGSNNAGPDKEKFQNGTEAVPKNIYIRNNYFLENCYFFPGCSPIATYFTQNMWIEHNFIYKCSYSAMSIGWGWCNFDGEVGSDSQLPGLPTTTSRNNHVNYNRIEDYASILQDCGGIYTLGQQGDGTPGGTDYSQYSEFNGNYINVYRETPDWVNEGRWINGFHPDEGSAYILFDSNVITNTLRNVYEMNNWRRKHDLVVTNGFSNSSKSETTAPNCSLDQYVSAESIWPKAGNNVVLNSGLEDEYTYLIDETVMPDSYYELASNVRLSAGDTLNRRGLLEADDEVWLAPAGTKDFAEGPTMTKAAGNEKTITVPMELGEYKLYIKYANGQVSDASEFTVYVGESKDLANVAEGQNYSVSELKPLVLELDTDNYTFTLNGEKIKNGHSISTEASWELKATPIGESEATKTITFTTSVSLANKLLPKNLTVSPEGLVEFAEALNDAGYSIWLAESGLSAFDENDPRQSYAAGDSASMKAPKTPGTYVLSVTKADDKTQIDSQSDAKVRVLNMVTAGNGLATYGTPTIGEGETDPIWNSAPALVIEKHLTMKDNGTASGVAKAMWDEENLYVMVEVQDPVLNSDSSQVHEQDSIEIFVDETNCKASSYQAGMGQYRINYKNEQTFNGSGIEEGFESYARIVDGGYVIEAKIPFKTVDPAANDKIGFDVQINDANADGTRQDIVMWYDETGNSWQSGANWGEVTLEEKSPIPTNGLNIWLNADRGVTLGGDDGDSVLSWENQGSMDATFTAEAETAPTLGVNENGVPSLVFSGGKDDQGTLGGDGDFMTFDGVDFNNKSEMTMIVVSHYTGKSVGNPSGDWTSGDKYCAIFAEEAGGWGSLFMSPYHDWTSARFGTGKDFCNIKYYDRDEIDRTAVTIATKDGAKEKLYVDGVLGAEKNDAVAVTKNIGSKMHIGASYSDYKWTYFKGTISEILIYDRALSDAEIEQVNTYLTQKYVTSLESITVSGPTKTQYEIGDELDLTGLVVTAHYSDGSEAAVEDYEVSGFDSSTAGEKTITVTYQDKTTTFTVNVKEAAPVVTLESITVSGPTKTEYEIGDELDLTGLVVTAHYSDGNEKVLSAGDYEVSGFDSSTAGEKTITVTYQDKTTAFTVNVKEAAPVVTLESITVSGPTKTEYKIGEELDLTGLVVTAHYSTGDEATVTGYEVSGFDSSTAGEKTITVTYQGKTAAFKVTVKETEKPVVTLESITVSGPNKTEYKIGEELDLTGLVVIAHYSDGSYQEVTDYEVSGFDSAAAGEKTVTVTYQGETVSFKITVKEDIASSEQPGESGKPDDNQSSSQPDDTQSGSGSQDDQNIQTGDSMAPYVGVAIVLILLSGLGVAIALIIRRRRLG